MFSQFSHHIVIDGEMIILDELRDEYIFLGQEETDKLLTYLSSRDIAEPPVATALLKKKILESTGNFNQWNAHSSHKSGIDHYEWYYAARQVKHSANMKLRIRALLCLYKIKFYLLLFGFHRTLLLLRKIKLNSHKEHVAEHLQQAEMLSCGVKQAARYAPFKVECLEHALTTFFLCAADGIRSEFKIGIQTYNFLSHAWLEVDEKVIGDMPELSKKMHVLLHI